MSVRQRRSESLKVQQKVQARRREIYAAAAELFSTHGYRAASMRELAAALGMSKASLYHYVQSKEELLTLLYTEVIAENTAIMQAVIDLGLSAAETLREVLVQRVLYTITRQRLLRVFYEEELELPPTVSGPMRQERQHYEHTLLSVVQRGLDEGVLTSPVSAQMTANILLGAVNWTYRWYKAGGPLRAREFAEGVADTAMGGIVSPSALTADLVRG
ncbi:TetR/AcrR family transcriptional regulator [Deinococcus psychrotolerans]|uniref:TetR/AcrR family transcriptional regulator n=1 Tax=Deinococcus psychrotolerans TaxID=2489213 RepID=A0A3G8YF80_9DEIO|nr:TetR/AcrR family transcriptional regulator [Deinococcus psychrotolerans]AZI43633.1 TetR/AcrR family transcriptional regulator [Deinococcus psychrotolerans]